MSSPNKAALAAVRALLEVEKGSFSNLALKAQLSALKEARERSFASSLFLGTLERKRTIDHLLSPYLKKGVEKLDPEVRAVLESGVYRQLWMSGNNVAAPVSDSVELVRVLRKTSASGLVNAVLRKTATIDLASLKSEPEDIRYSVNPKLYSVLAKQYGEKTTDILESFFHHSMDAVRVNTLRTDAGELKETLEKEGVTVSRTDVPDSLYVQGDFIHTTAFSNGLFHSISLSAQSSALSLGAKEGERILDLCAAPGGKTLLIAEMMKDKGEIIALDKYKTRTELIDKNAARLGIKCIRTMARDASGDLSDLGTFDRVLCDVPCSGFGEIAKKPELRYKDPAVSADLPTLQYQLLENAAKLVKKDGIIVYSTCTILRAENESITERFLKEHADFRLSSLCGAIPEKEAEKGQYLFVPGMAAGDRNEGFYIASFERL